MGLETYKDPPKAESLNFPKKYLVETRNLYATWLAEDHRIEIDFFFSNIPSNFEISNNLTQVPE